ncbi:uroporphyrinogen-III C-methyltransferase [Alishewanella jeotgali]|uniref:Uroporphyrin-III C-methyltransferase n=1 Tax=Alishewanella jeotgali KCTC 22429 TaxID=1129374 RepID=H3ZER4_9ALTE|nr:uroporphyrinogen-III C-methyltransferase [Alishewanella jeotgali]EHR40921.1 uroporphyrin-III C-methyltransferase [Alishewanella jeotgali KCTC 22429]
MSEQKPSSTDSDAPLAELKAQLAETENEPAGSTGSGVAALALLLVLLTGGGMAAAGWWLWPQWQGLQQQLSQSQRSVQQLEQQLAQTLAQVAEQQSQQLGTVEQQWQSWQQRQQTSQAELNNQLQHQLALLRQQLQEKDGAPPQHWQLAEVAYLLKRASYNLVLQQDLPSARMLLQQADAQLARLDNPALLNVRQSIRDDLAALKQLSLPDYSQVHLQLAQLRQQSLRLPLKQQEQALVTEPVVDAELANWRQNLAAYWQQSWSKLFQVRPAVAEDFINLTAEQQLQLRLTLQQQLLLAEQALLQREAEVFSRAVQQAADLLQRYFADDAASVQQAATALVQLSQLALTKVELPVLQSPAQLERQLALLSEEAL